MILIKKEEKVEQTLLYLFIDFHQKVNYKVDVYYHARPSAITTTIIAQHTTQTVKAHLKLSELLH